MSSLASLAVTNPNAPFLCTIPTTVHPGQIFIITGRMLSDDRFRVDFRTGSDMPDETDEDTEDEVFHLSINPSYDEIARNSCDESGWGEEENSGGCPIKYNQEFKMMILVDVDKFKVAINDRHFCEFRHRKPFWTAKFLSIRGEIKIHFIEIRNGFQ